MLIIPWSCLLFWLSSLVGLRSSGCYYITVMSVTWCLSPWSSIVIFSVTYRLLTWSSVVKSQVTCYLSIWSSSTWVFLVTCLLSVWSSITWSWFKVKNVNNDKDYLILSKIVKNYLTIQVISVLSKRAFLILG